MSDRKVFGLCAAAGIALSLLLPSSASWSQGDQVLSDVGAMGRVANGDQGVVRPDFAGELAGDYDPWVQVTSGRNFKSFAISVFGTALVLDGTTIREFDVAGQPITDRGFPVNCTDLTVATQKGGPGATSKLTDCTDFTPLNDGTLRIAGEVKGNGFFIVAYDPETGATELKATGAPGISDMDGDQFADSDDRRGAGYWAIGDRKNVFFFPLGDEQNFRIVATINGVTLFAVTPFGVTPSGDGRVIVATEGGALLAVNTSTGATSTFAQLPTGAACGLRNRDPQTFSLRGDPSGVLYAGNMGCRTITVFDPNGTALQPGDGLAANPFGLENPAPFRIEGLDWQAGEGGDFDDCDGVSISEACEIGLRENQGVLWNVTNIGDGDTRYRMFQFVDLVDCRWSGDRPCPILNCPEADGKPGGCPVSNREEQVLDLAQLLIRADESGAFRTAAFGDGPVPKMAIPPYMRGEEAYPDDNGDPVPNFYRFHSFFAVTDAVFTGNFFTDYQLDDIRGDGTDPCIIPPRGSTVEEVNETANLIVYNSSDPDFGTVDRGGEVGTRGGVIINDACNGRAIGSRWSAQTVGLELYEPDEHEDAYVHRANDMMQELIKAKDELLCSPFAGNSQALLLGSDCSRIAGELDQMKEKLATCFGSMYAPLSGNSAENCSAFFTKVQNLRDVLDAAAWPDPNNAAFLPLLKPNYEGEFRGRLATLVFFVQSYVVNSVPPGGFTPD